MDEPSPTAVVTGDGYALAHFDTFGEGPGFRKIRTALGVHAFGINAIVMPPHHTTGRHYHEQQEETYFVHRGAIEFEFGDGTTHRVDAGGFVRVDAPTVRRLRNLTDGDAVYVCVGGRDGYVGRDGRVAEGETSRSGVSSDGGGGAAEPAG